MNLIAKNVVSGKLSSLSKNIGLDDDNDANEEQGTMTAKERRQQQEKEATEKAKREEKYAKRHAQREKKREDIRAKYGLQKDEKGQSMAKNDSKTAPKEEQKKEDEEKQCVVM
ncbi:complexin-2-like [Actinia tenebrosa]|uniref:Complexin-2-like n=1 Tax=Actinia tenebrosa TaxID=6105 RepID=A0A6P8IG71_ACTTE|nr:complexin-2-like [Actinia tenebrosa]